MRRVVHVALLTWAIAAGAPVACKTSVGGDSGDEGGRDGSAGAGAAAGRSTAGDSTGAPRPAGDVCTARSTAFGDPDSCPTEVAECAAESSCVALACCLEDCSLIESLQRQACQDRCYYESSSAADEFMAMCNCTFEAVGSCIAPPSIGCRLSLGELELCESLPPGSSCAQDGKVVAPTVGCPTKYSALCRGMSGGNVYFYGPVPDADDFILDGLCEGDLETNAGSGEAGGSGPTAAGSAGASGRGDASGTGGSGDLENPLGNPEDGPPAGRVDGGCPIPSEAGLEDSSDPDHVVGTGSPETCTAEAFVDAVAQGGVITFDCGEDPVTITLDEPAKVYNDAADDIVIDGAGLVTLSGGGSTRILYMNTCDEAQHWTTNHCDNQETPRLTVQNLTFVDADSRGETEYDGGGAIWVRGGRFKVVNSRFFNNVCADEGPDVGGGAIRVFSQHDGLPVYVVNSTFGGAEGLGNVCSNGGGISSIGVSWTIINSLFSYNEAIGNGGNPAESGTPGGGSGGGIYNDGNTMTLSLCGTLLEYNEVQAYGAAIFFVTNDHTGTIRIEDSVIRNNVGGSWHTLPGIAMHDDTQRVIDEDSILENGPSR
jgi:hypothetical protein